MKFSNIKSMCRLTVPGAKSTRVNNTQLELLINEVVLDIAMKLALYKRNKKFNITAETDEYSLATIASDFLTMDEMGAFWYDGSQWQLLDPYTIKQLDEEFRMWRDDDSGDPQRYSTDGDVFTLHNKPDTTLAQGGWLYYIARPETMTAASDFPFHVINDKKTEISQYAFLSKAIVLGVDSILSKPLGENEDVQVLKESVYEKELKAANVILNRRIDISASTDTRFHGPTIGRNL